MFHPISLPQVAEYSGMLPCTGAGTGHGAKPFIHNDFTTAYA
jgi:hypothetical protein